MLDHAIHMEVLMARRHATRTALIVLIVAMALVAAACSDDSSDVDAGPTAAPESCQVADLNLVTPGTLTVATGEPAFPPWVGTPDGEFFDEPESGVGFESALVYAIAEELGFAESDVVWTRIGFNEAIAPGEKPWDFNIQQYSITEDRKEVVDFSSPYYVTTQALIAYPDSPYASATSVGDLKDAVLGAQIGTTSLDFIEDVIKPDTEPNVYDENVDLEAAMNAGQIDALVVDLPTGYYITAAQVEGSIIAGQFEAEAANPDEYGMLFAKGNSLVPCVNTALEALRESGKLQELEDTYLTQEGGIPTISD
jgi:polar amino acid transport system substrate-binding protein